MPTLPCSNLQNLLTRLKKSCGTIYWRQAVLSAPAILIVMALSMKLNPVMAVVVVGAAFSAGFGAARSIGKHRWRVMGQATLGMALAAFAGSLAGSEPAVALAAAALLAAVCAALSSYNNNWWWIMLQIVIAFLVAAYYPGTPEAAALRSLCILTGGGLQMAFTMLLARITPASAAPLPPPPATPLPSQRLLRFAAGTGLAVGLALYAAESAGLKNNYWAAMTALLVLRPASADTLTRGVNRFIGTLTGCAAATLAVYAFHDAHLWLTACLTITSAAAFSMQRAHYGLFTAMVSATIVFLIAIGHGDPLATTEHRLLATLLGGSTAIATGRLFRL
ncbi:FUSC family protein [Uruburuella testudinis]|uniref:FUSC family protein n=1 Tax=Uruburuella testudinis TaxID=1282863 RepID=A0ABY4DVB0_9NEIS|nr:FUSC family protein [Uruburuella testudinis]UOO82967.1 FUSC family protein [Uruburuella testudinis]